MDLEGQPEKDASQNAEQETLNDQRSAKSLVVLQKPPPMLGSSIG